MQQANDACNSSAQRTESSAVNGLELDTAAKTEDGTTSKRSFVVSKSCTLYLLIIGFIWLLHTIPILVFFSIDAMVSVANNCDMHVYQYIFCKFQFFPNETVTVNNTGREGNHLLSGVVCFSLVFSYIYIAPKCSRDFFLDNSSGLCRPECGEWDQYSPATRRAVYGVNITFILVTIIVCVVTFVWSIFRHKIM